MKPGIIFNKSDLLLSLATLQNYCVDPTTINDGKVFVDAYDKIKEALKIYAEENNSRYIIEKLSHFPSFTEQEINSLIENEKEWQGTEHNLSFVVKEFSEDELSEPFKSLNRNLVNIINVLTTPGVEELYYNMVANPAATIFTADYKAENFTLRLLKNGLFKFLPLALLLLVAFYIKIPFLILFIIGFLIIMTADLGFFPAIRETKFSILKIVAYPENLQIQYSEWDKVKEITEPWDNIVITLKQNPFKFFPVQRILSIKKNDETTLTLYSSFMNELNYDKIEGLAIELDKIQKATLLIEKPDVS